MTLSTLSKGTRLAQIALCLILAGCVVVLTINLRHVLRSSHSAVKEIQATAVNAKETSQQLKDYAIAQREMLQSPRNQKSIEANLQVGPNAVALFKSVNTQTLPRVNRTLDGLTESTNALQAAIWETKAALAVNSGHVSELLVEAKGVTSEFRATAAGLNTVATGLGAEVPAVAAEFKTLIAAGRVTTEQVNALLADPKLPELLSQAERLVRETGDIAVNVDAATAELPPIMKSARRWQGPLNLARILSVLLGLL